MKEETKRLDCFDICVDGSGKTTGNLRQDSEHLDRDRGLTELSLSEPRRSV